MKPVVHNSRNVVIRRKKDEDISPNVSNNSSSQKFTQVLELLTIIKINVTKYQAQRRRGLGLVPQ